MLRPLLHPFFPVIQTNSHVKPNRVRNRRELNSSLKGSTLGDADAEGDDALNWVKKSKKREKALAKKRLEELESRDNMYQDEYTERMFPICRARTDCLGLL